jgi:hypothetical protein
VPVLSLDAVSGGPEPGRRKEKIKVRQRKLGKGKKWMQFKAETGKKIKVKIFLVH